MDEATVTATADTGTASTEAASPAAEAPATTENVNAAAATTGSNSERDKILSLCKTEDNKADAAPLDKAAAAASEAGKDSTASTASDPAKDQAKRAKDQERLNLTWEKANAEKAALAKERESIAREKASLEQAKAAATPARDQHGLTAQDYRAAAKDFAKKGDHNSAQAAEQLAQMVDRIAHKAKADAQFKRLSDDWTTNYNAICEKDPAFKDANSELYKEALGLINEHKLLQTTGDGIKLAYEAAKVRQQAKTFDGTKAELDKLKADYAKLQKKISIEGGSPTSAPAEEKSFGKMSLANQRKYLERTVHNMDRERDAAYA